MRWQPNLTCSPQVRTHARNDKTIVHTLWLHEDALVHKNHITSLFHPNTHVERASALELLRASQPPPSDERCAHRAPPLVVLVMVGGPTALRVLSHGIYFRALRTKCVIWQLTVDFDGLKNQTLAVAAVIRLCSENVCGVRVFYRRRVCVCMCCVLLSSWIYEAAIKTRKGLPEYLALPHCVDTMKVCVQCACVCEGVSSNCEWRVKFGLIWIPISARRRIAARVFGALEYTCASAPHRTQWKKVAEPVQITLIMNPSTVRACAQAHSEVR